MDTRPAPGLPDKASGTEDSAPSSETGLGSALRRDVALGASRLLTPFLLACGDLLALGMAISVAFFLRTRVLGHWFPLPFTQTYFDLLSRVWIPATYVGVFSFDGLYSRREPFWEETRRLVRSVFFATLTVFAIVSLGKMSGEISRAIVVGTGLFSLALVPLVRFWWKPFLHKRGLGIKKTVLIGDNAWGRLAHLGLFRDHYMGIRIVGEVGLARRTGWVRREELPARETLSGLDAPTVPFLGDLSGLEGIVKVQGIRGAVVALPEMRREEFTLLMDEIQKQVLSVYLVPNIAQVNLVNSELLYLFYEEIFLLGIHNNLKSRANRWIKNASDIVLAALLCVPLIPLIAIIGLLVAVDSPGPIFYSQLRIGPGKRPFRIFKFRTMVEGAEAKLEKLLEENPELREEFEEKQKLLNDPRITRVGRFLRRTSLDELPQIVNVLRGEMSLVGPRPVTQEELASRYRENGEIYGLVKPGITGLWQVSGRSIRGYEIRVRLDLWYIRNWSLWMDLVILVRTVGVVLGRKGSC